MTRVLLTVGTRRHFLEVVALLPLNKVAVRCDCGTVKVVGRSHFRSVKSCGCMRPALSRAKATTHGMSGKPEYTAWNLMKDRCFNQSCEQYANYGGRGITVSPIWLGAGGFQRFLADMGRRPSAAHSLDRERVNGNYEPGNCRWATAKEQQRNRRNNTVLAIRGESHSAAEWAERAGIRKETLYARLARGWEAERAVFAPVGTK